MQFGEVAQHVVAQGDKAAVATVARARQVDIENAADTSRRFATGLPD